MGRVKVVARVRAEAAVELIYERAPMEVVVVGVLLMGRGEGARVVRCREVGSILVARQGLVEQLLLFERQEAGVVAPGA